MRPGTNSFGRMCDSGSVRQIDPQITAVGFLDQPARIVQRAVVGVNGEVISIHV